MSRKFEVLTPAEFSSKGDKEWPITYILYNDSMDKMYVGISKNFSRRMLEHSRDVGKMGLNNELILSHTHANQSISYYLESYLIHHLRSNNKIKSINTKVQSGELFNNNSFHNKELTIKEAYEVYDKLYELGIVDATINEIKNSELSKLHPDLPMTDEQVSVINESIKLINNSKTFFVNGTAGTGKTAIIFKILNDYHLENKFSNKTIGVYSTSTKNRVVIKRFITLLSEYSKLKFFGTFTELEKWISKNGKENMHLLVDEAQSLNTKRYGTYGLTKTLIQSKYEDEFDWITDNVESTTFFYDKYQSDYFKDVTIDEKINDCSIVFELQDQFRIKADKKIFKLFKEILDIEDSYESQYENYGYNIEVVDTLKDGMKKIETLNKRRSKICKILGLTSYNKKSYEKGKHGIDLVLKNMNTVKDIKDEPLETVLNSRAVKGLSIDDSLLIIDDFITYDSGLKINIEKLDSKNPIQSRTNHEQIKMIKNMYFIMMTRSTDNLIIYAADNELRNHIRKMIAKLKVFEG